MHKGPSALYTIAAVFVLLGILFIPFPFHLYPFQLETTDAVWGGLIRFTASNIFQSPLKETKVYSDFRSMYVLVFLLLLLSTVAGFMLRHFLRHKELLSRITHIIFLVSVYYLALMLMKYGLDKVFKHQFYLPEPNILYTPLGKVDKDLLYWSSMGTSRAYNLFAGGVEVIAALLLLFRRTRFAGALLAVAVMAQVLVINLSFDISVKLYAAFLLLCGLLILSFYKSRLRIFFSSTHAVNFEPLPVVEPIQHPFVRTFLKSLATGLLLFESFYPYLKSGNYNDDTAARPYLHGAYEIKQFISGTDTSIGNAVPVKRIFIHRQGYLIFQDQEDRMQDYKLDYSPDTHNYVLTDYQQHKTPLELHYNEADSLLTVGFRKQDKQIQLSARVLDWRKLPVLKKDFHWTVD